MENGMQSNMQYHSSQSQVASSPFSIDMIRKRRAKWACSEINKNKWKICVFYQMIKSGWEILSIACTVHLPFSMQSNFQSTKETFF